MPISLERWKLAQENEITHHDPVSESSLNHYKGSYQHVLDYWGISFDLAGKSILEIGPGRIGCLLFCENFKQSYVLDPLPFPDSEPLYHQKSIQVIQEPAETAIFPKVDEIWLINVLQHVIDPDLILTKALNTGIVRVFEPINVETDVAHPWRFDFDYFAKRLENVKLFKGRTFPNFHTADCVYT